MHSRADGSGAPPRSLSGPAPRPASPAAGGASALDISEAEWDRPGLILGALYEAFGSLVAFGWGAALALVTALMLTGVRRDETTAAITRA
jgi:hypothetical protein